MEQVDRKRIAKSAIIATSLIMGAVAAQTFFNEAKADDGKTKAWVYITSPSGTSQRTCGTIKGTDC